MMKKLFVLLFVLALAFPFAQKASAAESLQQLIDHTPVNGVLQLEGKTYEGPASITKPMTMIGQEGTKIISETTGLTITNTADVTLQQLTFETISQPLDVANVQNIHLEGLTLRLKDQGAVLKNTAHVKIKNTNIIGLKEAHFSRKANGFELYESSDIEVDAVTVINMQDGLYFERIKNVHVTNTEAENGRYGLHFMYGENIVLQNNIVQNNVTGLMLMIITNLQVNSNEIARQLVINSIGMYLYDVKNANIRDNHFRENTVATVWSRVTDTLFEHNEFQSNGTVVESARSSEVKVTNNMFQGNILVARSDQRGFDLQQNTYDDYKGYDFDQNGIGDTPHQTYTSFGQWMVRKPVYQYFIESPSVVLLNKMDGETETVDDSLLVDPLPKIAAAGISLQFNIVWWQLLVGLLTMTVILLGWRKLG